MLRRDSLALDNYVTRQADLYPIARKRHAASLQQILQEGDERLIGRRHGVIAQSLRLYPF